MRANGVSDLARAEATGLARFFAENIATAATGLAETVVTGGHAVVDLDIPLAS